MENCNKQSSCAIAPLLLGRGRHTELTRRISRILSKWLPHAVRNFHEWDGRPNCGYFFTGCQWYGEDQNSMCLVTALMAACGELDEQTAGVTRGQLFDMAVKTLRYACFTHDTGPADCVRVDGKNKRQALTKWGGRDAPYFQATQVGTQLPSFAIGAWILWDRLDDETRGMCFHVLSDFADRWSSVEPRSGSYFDTQCEENGWTAAGISAAACLFPNHPSAKKWRDAATRWTLNSMATPLDMHDRSLFEGKSFAHGWVSCITFHPDFTTENHGMVHPDYMMAGPQLRNTMAILPILGGQAQFPGILHNWADIYNRTLKVWATPEGSAVPVQSQDWWYYKHTFILMVHAATNILLGSGDAACLERCALDFLERTQAGNESGCFIENEPEKYKVDRDFQTLADMERCTAEHLSFAFLWHYMCGEGEEPTPREELDRKLAGTYIYPFGSTAVKRGPESFACFSWRNVALAAVLPRDYLWSVTVPPASTFGTVRFADSGARSGGLSNETNILSVEDEQIVRLKDGFSAVARIRRGDGELIQDIAFVPLPDETAVYFERFTAERDCELLELKTGLVGVRNEHYPHLGDYAKGYRDLYLNSQPPVRMPGYFGGEDREYSFRDVRTAALDDRIAYVMHGSAGVLYQNRHDYSEKWKGIEDFLVLNARRGRISLHAGEALAPFILVYLPNRGIDAANSAAKRFHIGETDAENTYAVLLGGRLVYANTDAQRRSLEARFSVSEEELPLFEGYNAVCTGEVTWSGFACPRTCGFRDAALMMKNTRGACAEVYITPGRGYVIRNISSIALVFTDTRGTTFSVPAGETFAPREH